MSKEKENLVEEELEDLPEEEEKLYYEYDPDFLKNDEEEIKEEETEEEEEVEEIEEEKEEKSEEKETKEKQRNLDEEVEAILKNITKDDEVKSKGVKFPAQALTKEEALALLNKGFRFYQAMEELAQKEKALQAKEEQLNQVAQQLLDYRAKLESGAGSQAQKASKTYPPELLPSDDDDPTAASLKKAARDLWDRVVQTEERLHTTLTEQELAKQNSKILKEIENAVADFPLASPEEVLLVYLASNGKATPKELAALSHKQRANIDYVKKLLNHVPEVKKMLRDEIIKEYLAEKETKKVPIKSGVTKKVVQRQGKKEPITFDNISQKLRERLAELARSPEED